MIIIFDKIIFIHFHFSLANCEATREGPPSSSRPEQGVPAVDPEVEASYTSFGAAEVRPHVDIPSPVSSIGNSLLITPLIRHDTGSWPIE